MNANPSLSDSPRRGRKYDAALEGARAIFMRDGFEGASVDDIARAAGISKATLYSYFPDKTRMFLAVLEVECTRQTDMIGGFLSQDAPLEDVLFQQCRFFVAFLLSDWAVEIFRVVSAESRRFPELGRQFYEAGPAAMLRVLEDFLSSPQVAADLDVPDPALAAQQLKMLCHTDMFIKRMFGLMDAPRPEEIDRIARAAVDTFLARYGRKPLSAAAE